MNKTKFAGLALSLLMLTGTAINCRAQNAPTAKMAKGQVLFTEFPLGQNGLYFGGKKNVDYIFGARITPHGDCITAIPGYVFVSWYRAPRDDRHLMISRLNLQTGVWKHVELPERNTLGRINGTKKVAENLGDADMRGESHRTAAVGVCPLDGTVHLLFDMHASDLQYIVSKPGIATAPDDEFVAASFKPKQDGFVAGQKLKQRITYPSFQRNDKGALFAMWREGGSGNGNQVSALYDGKNWSKPDTTWFGNYKDPKQNISIYGSQQYLNGRMMAGFAIRTPSTPIEVNQGLYFAESGQKTSDDWVDLKGVAHKIPIKDYAPFMVDEPVPNNDYRMSSSPNWTVSAQGDVHMIVKFNAKPSIHYYRPSGAKTFIKSPKLGAPTGELYAAGARIFALDQDKGQLEISSTPAGKDDWRNVGTVESSRLEFGNSVVQDGVLYYFAMKEVGDPQSQPLTLLAIDLKNID